MTESEARFCLVSDDGHYYLCPANKRDEAHKYLEEIYDYWENCTMSDRPEPARPDWLENCNGYHTLTFANPREDVKRG